MIDQDGELGSVREEMAKLKVLMWEKEKENRQLHERLRIAKDKGRRYFYCLTEEQGLKAAFCTQLRNKQSQ